MHPGPPHVRDMFDRIAPRYDRLNSALSFGLDRRWRRRVGEAAEPLAEAMVLDVACGSGPLSRELVRRGGRVVGIDFSAEMLRVAAGSVRDARFAQADALRLPFADERFERVTIGFGLRNLFDAREGLCEMRRVTAPDGRLVVLEFVRPPRGIVGLGYRLYLRLLVPLVGRLLSGDAPAYRYLSRSIQGYLSPGELERVALDAGWSDVRSRLLNFGTVVVLSAVRSTRNPE